MKVTMYIVLTSGEIHIAKDIEVDNDKEIVTYTTTKNNTIEVPFAEFDGVRTAHRS